MAAVVFTVRHRFDQPARAVWDELVDWKGHANWIPATRVEVAPGDPLAVGAEFTAWTGLGRLSLEDRMQVAAIDWDEASASGTCRVDKLGPILTGHAGFTVQADGDATELEWLEDVEVRRLPRILAPVAARIGAAGFKLAMYSLARTMAKRRSPVG